MTTTERERTSPVAVLVGKWRIFWFRPEPATTLGVVRIAYGLVVTGWAMSLLPDLDNMFGDRSVMPRPPSREFVWGFLPAGSGHEALLTVWWVLLVSAIALTVGWHSRLAALAVFVCVMSFMRSDPFVFNSGDVLVRMEAFFLVLAPSGAALSLDRRRTAGSFWSAQVRAPWVLRLMQIQLTVIYLFSVLNKLSGDTWREGTAVSYALRMTDIGNFPLPGWLTTNALLMNAATWSALLTEIAIGVLVWNRRLRPWALAAGVCMHATIMITFAIAFFTFAMYVLYLAFVPSDAMQRLVDGVRRRPAQRPDLRPPVEFDEPRRVLRRAASRKSRGSHSTG